MVTGSAIGHTLTSAGAGAHALGKAVARCERQANRRSSAGCIWVWGWFVRNRDRHANTLNGIPPEADAAAVIGRSAR